MEYRNLTITHEQSIVLCMLGITARAHFYHFSCEAPAITVEENGTIEKGKVHEWIVLPMNEPPGGDALPAWTKAEIDIMIGNAHPKPDLPRPDKIGKATDSNSYMVFYPNKLVTFTNGAQASADLLIYLIEQRQIDPGVASKRHQKVFKY